MFEYKINIDKNVLRLLGAQLYGDTPSIIAELVQNAYDADAKRVWITITTIDAPKIIVQDDGIGMTSNEINDRFLNIGQDRREMFPLSPGGRKVLGRKGIGKLAVFSLAKVIDVVSQKENSSDCQKTSLGGLEGRSPPNAIRIRRHVRRIRKPCCARFPCGVSLPGVP